jgi:hypothetical protein
MTGHPSNDGRAVKLKAGLRSQSCDFRKSGVRRCHGDRIRITSGARFILRLPE